MGSTALKVIRKDRTVFLAVTKVDKITGAPQSPLGRSSGEGHGNLLQYSCLENPCGQRSLVGCGPWGHKEWDTTELLSTLKAPEK